MSVPGHYSKLIPYWDLWLHARDLTPVSGDAKHANFAHLVAAFTAAFLCVAFGIADFVLYAGPRISLIQQGARQCPGTIVRKVL